ncbi:Response regulator [Sulfidibacter corallicola]|uniref:histidine kinase n=1 Tax=Sulfidibacter corallicola TaxID=2818388 RepID=A0A8A4TS96_SULCO|nr:two-component regulator propeller domain-containing protein [Sulfidibacter corallicola]QTD52836.1 response regulator [Sulfidibacter corallicola]
MFLRLLIGCHPTLSFPSGFFRVQAGRALRLGSLFALLLGTAELAAQPRYLNLKNYSTEHGLSQSTVICIAQDKTGFVWLGTQDGLNRFDGYEFKTYKHHLEDPGSLADSWVNTLYVDGDGVLWVGTRDGGLDRFDEQTETFTHFAPSPDNGLASSDIRAILEDSHGRFWLGTNRSGLYQMDRTTGRFTQINLAGHPTPGIAANIRTIFEDRAGVLWLSTIDRGVYSYHPDNGALRHWAYKPGEPDGLSDNAAGPVMQDRRGRIWVGTRDGMLNCIDAIGGTVRRINLNGIQTSGPTDVWSLLEDQEGNLWIGSRTSGLFSFHLEEETFSTYPQGSQDRVNLAKAGVQSLFRDRTGVIWIGTMSGGVVTFDPASQKFPHYKHLAGLPGVLSHDGVYALFEDSRGIIWIGTLGGGINRLDPGKRYFRYFRFDAGDREGLLSDSVTSFGEDADGRIWVGTQSGLSILDVPNNKFENHVPDPDNPHALAAKGVSVLYRDRDDTMWVGTAGGGLARWEPERRGFTNFRYRPDDPESLSNDWVMALHQDRDGALWIGTWGGGVARLDLATEKFRTYRLNKDDPSSLSNNRIRTILEDHAGNLWFGSAGGGVNRYHPESQSFTHFREVDGLANNTVYSILEDAQQLLWISTNRGLTRYNPISGAVRNFDRNDGLQADEFNSGAAMRASDGRLFFGGINGYNAFFPDEVKADQIAPVTVVTELSLFNQPMPLNVADPESPLSRPIHLTRQLDLGYRDHVFSFSFAALHYSSPVGNRFAYKLEGLDPDWVYTDASRRFATYTKLPSGSYTFRVKSANKDDVWDNEGVSIKLRIASPPWRTSWAMLLYALVLVFSGIWFHSAQRRKLAFERRVNTRLRALDKMKDEFLANTSHELRTPLNGIIGLAESLREGVAGPVSPEARHNLELIVSSGRRLTRLVNDILDFSKLEHGNLTLDLKAIDLHALTDVVLTMLNPIATAKQLPLINRVPVQIPPIYADEERLQQILFNLVGNAVKFTDVGRVTVKARVVGNMTEIAVVDTGIGIAPKHRESIFKSFEQVDSATDRRFSGTGLGLAITRHLVNLHGGKLWVESVPGEGSTFFFSLPCSAEGQEAVTGPTIPMISHAPSASGSAIASCVETGSGDMPTILIVDDEPVNRKVLVNYLMLRKYRLLEASSGQEALDHLNRDERIDMILLDVMMPRMPGYQVCRKVRERYSRRELPIIFLTAKSRETDQWAAFQEGANDFLSKPIEKGELLSRVALHLELLKFQREMERKVAERTRELEQKNREMETLDTIVKTINREVELGNVVETLLNQALVLFPGASVAGHLMREIGGRRFRIDHVVGEAAEFWQGKAIGTKELLRGIAASLNQVGTGLYVSDSCRERFLAASATDFPLPQSLIALLTPVERRLEGAILIAHHEHTAVFGPSDVEKAVRFREHALNALTKAAALRDLAETQKELVEAAHTAGRAEIAIHVLHNVGNILNSVNTSAHLLEERLQSQRWPNFLDRLVSSLDSERNLRQLVADGDRRERFSQGLNEVRTRVQDERSFLKSEFEVLQSRISDIATILREQQKYTDVRGLMEAVELNQLVQHALHVEGFLFRPGKMRLLKHFGDIPSVRSSNSRLTRVLFYLFQNAWEAIEARATEEEGFEGTIEITTRMRGQWVELELTDDGVGLPEGVGDRVYTQGYSTKPNRLGLGLHYCANTLMEMNGEISIQPRSGKPGTVVRLHLLPVVSGGEAR